MPEPRAENRQGDSRKLVEQENSGKGGSNREGNGGSRRESTLSKEAVGRKTAHQTPWNASKRNTEGGKVEKKGALF